MREPPVGLDPTVGTQESASGAHMRSVTRFLDPLPVPGRTVLDGQPLARP